MRTPTDLLRIGHPACSAARTVIVIKGTSIADLRRGLKQRRKVELFLCLAAIRTQSFFEKDKHSNVPFTPTSHGGILANFAFRCEHQRRQC
eukprot:2666731-Pleurochrysis_carterae.AAC.1